MTEDDIIRELKAAWDDARVDALRLDEPLTDEVFDRLVDEGRIKFATFIPRPASGAEIVGPVQVYVTREW